MSRALAEFTILRFGAQWHEVPQAPGSNVHGNESAETSMCVVTEIKKSQATIMWAGFGGSAGPWILANPVVSWLS